MRQAGALPDSTETAGGPQGRLHRHGSDMYPGNHMMTDVYSGRLSEGAFASSECFAVAPAFQGTMP
jgi:hypothetical protein